ncbi:hypothetical protein LY78DRAFT_663507 [Colletotrichum sublineola]|nr:hypothetical protein LY78DRAFT_663507 [Colletotrichum sublineola]
MADKLAGNAQLKSQTDWPDWYQQLKQKAYIWGIWESITPSRDGSICVTTNHLLEPPTYPTLDQF